VKSRGRPAAPAPEPVTLRGVVPDRAARDLRKASRLLVAPALAAVLAGCVLVDLVLLPLKLVFGAVGAVGEGASGAVGAVVSTEPLEGPPPRVEPLDDGRWLVEAPSDAARFRVTLSAAGRESRTWTWPDDFRGAPVAADGSAHIDCFLEPSR